MIIINETASGKGVVPGTHGVPDMVSTGRHQATDRTNERIKW